MPTYEYECAACGHRFERFQGIAEKPLAQCPECGKPVRRLIGSGAAILMKGGFSRGDEKACSLTRTGSTCCGRNQRCGKPPCGREG
jgi:putative FmdB family regulatory protein